MMRDNNQCGCLGNVIAAMVTVAMVIVTMATADACQRNVTKITDWVCAQCSLYPSKCRKRVLLIT